jgi:hypothetical protein
MNRFPLDPVVRPEAFSEARRVGCAKSFFCMLKKVPLFIALVFGIGVAKLHAQAPPGSASSPLELIAINGAGNEKHLSSNNGVLPMLMVRPNQVVPITLQFPSDKAGMPVAAIPLDGGRINRNDLVILPTGQVIFTFSPGAMPGRYRVMVQTPIERHLLEFYVVDPTHPPGSRRN